MVIIPRGAVRLAVSPVAVRKYRRRLLDRIVGLNSESIDPLEPVELSFEQGTTISSDGTVA